MKLAIRASLVTLFLFTLVFTASAQSTRSENDPRNIAPTVGTGGPVGGPTGLFTVYDGQTLQRGEYTFSIAYSNYDRDPGDIDISSVPMSFQIGLSDKLELFFNTDAWRGVKVNSPRNLSGFYLPNSQVFIGGILTTPPAIVLAPAGPGNGPREGGAVFRPTGAPFVQFPFQGGNAGTYGLQFPFFSGPQFGYPAGSNALLGAFGSSGGGGADLFPGVGSNFGGILPGVVFSTTTLVNNAGDPVGEGPFAFTLAPTYAPDVPFINRQYGTSSFNTLDFGAKYRFNSPDNAVGYGLMAFYRWYLDTGDDFSGFNMMQRGAGPGGSNGDIGVTFFADARLHEKVNLSGNVGYIWTSKAKGNFGGQELTMLDRPDELQGAFGVDVPINKYLQYIFELRAIRYVGSRTPNALERHPLDGLMGIRLFPKRWWGLGFAYRYNFNQQDKNSFDHDSVITNTISVPCTPGGGGGGGGSVGGCDPIVISNSFSGPPPGFRVSDDANGFITQFFIGRRNERQGPIENKPANVDSVTLGDTVITLPCPPGTKSTSGGCNDNMSVSVSTRASDPENDVLTYNYTVSGGRITGQGANVTWDLSGAQPGTYTITTGVNDGCGICGKTDTKTITVEDCKDCTTPCACPPAPTVSGPSGVTSPGDTMTFTASYAGDATYNWTVSAGTIESGQGTNTITVRTTSDMAGQNVTATVELGLSGENASCGCPTSASETAGVAPKPIARIVDEFGDIQNDDVRARVDNFYVELNNDPAAKGFIINYGTPAQIRKRRALIENHIRFRKLDASRVTFVDGPDDGGGIRTRFWLVPDGADDPTP